MSDDAIPELIRAAGEPAARAYRQFLDDATKSPNTRRVYGNHIRRFCRWAEARGLPLMLVAGRDVAAHIESLSRYAASDVVSALRNLFTAMVGAGVLTENPCGRRWPRAYKGPAPLSPARCTYELQALHRQLMAELNKGDADDLTVDLIKNIERSLAFRAPTADEPAGGTTAHG
jgi:hypothetical protein